MDCYQMSFSLVEYIRNRHCLLFNHQINDKGGGFLNLFFVLLLYWVLIVSFQFSHSVVSDSCRSHGLQHTRPPCPSPTPAITNSRSLPKLISIELVMPSNHLILCHPFLLLPSIFPSTRVFFIESVIRIRWPEYWSFSFSISPSNEYSGLISFRMDWLGLLAVQGTLKSLLQHQSSEASILWRFLDSPVLTSIHDYWKNHSFY